MTPSHARATTTIASSSPLTARSLFSRWKAPLSSKARSNTEFYIQPDDPHRQYNPGDVISGSVIVKVLKALRVTHLVISLHGYAQVFKNPNAPGDAYKNYCATVGSGRGKKTGSYFGNGFASLFEDEVVLCGEGMLNEGVYHFNFELEFPARDLPSSIDFERGSITYMLTATLTRPTAISPTASHNINVSLMNTIDIASVPQPKPRVISLEPVSRRARTKPSRKRPVVAAIEVGRQTPNGQDAPQNSTAVDVAGPHSDAGGPRSPSPSDISFEIQSSSGNSGTEYGVRSVNTEVASSNSSNRNSLKEKTITASIDVLKGGFLRGDQIPVRITVNHTKHVRSLKGIIVTLYRQARVDMHPVLPVVLNGKGDKVTSDEYLPKSRTGLGGLSLSSAGSSHLFRKDLCQSFAPLFVDPRTLTAEVKCSVRVPEEAFPTISNVPGALISFKYYVEVILDIQGKLTGLNRMVEQASLLNVSSSAVGNVGTGRDDSTNSMFTTWGANTIDTDQIRREKGVVSALFEVVIGTKDSDRNGKRKQLQASPLPSHRDPRELLPSRSTDANTANEYNQNHYDFDENRQNYDSAYYDVPEYDQYGAGPSTPYSLPPVSAENEQMLSEKERMRRAEARLLPSQPPLGAVPSASNAGQHHIPASAPYIPDDEYDGSGNLDLIPHSSSSVMLPRPDPLSRTATSSSQQPIGSIHDGTTTAMTDIPIKPLPPSPPSSPSQALREVPAYSLSSAPHVSPTDDKQELQRRRLEMERSAPPEDDEEEAESSQQPSRLIMNTMRRPMMAPSAPVLDEDDLDLVDAVRPGRVTQENTNDRRESEVLPQYQR